jgi:conjugal transfer pilus assembly protein TraV
MMTGKRKILCALPLLALVAACSPTIGNPEFSCSGLPDRTFCMSAWDVYEATNDRDSLEDYTPPGEVEASKGSQSGSKSVDGGTGGYVPPPAEIAMIAPIAPGQSIPVRTPAKVIRIWFAPFEDNGALIAPSYVFSEVEARQWNIGHESSADNMMISPLKVLKYEKE